MSRLPPVDTIRLLQAGMAAFLVGAFALPTEAAYALVFYICVMAPAACCVRSLRPADAGLWLALSLIAWSALSLCWGEDSGRRGWHFLLGAVATAAFVLVLGRMMQAPRQRRLLAALLIWAGTANTLFVLLTGSPALLGGARILGWGITRQPILGGSVMAAACLSALAFGRAGRAAVGTGKGALAATLARLLAALVMAVFILALQSRGALVGFAAGLLVLLWCRWRWLGLAGATALAAAMAALAPPDLRAYAVRLAVQRGTSHRLEIWGRAWAAIREKPVFGHGLAANLPGLHTGFPHSLYLSLLFYSGAIGLGLFAALAAIAGRRLMRAEPGGERAWVAALLANALFAGLTDFGQITKGPGELWLILWLPLVLALCLPVSRRAAAPALPFAAS